jgi:lipoprotein-anchoring transpeptidase ErfK/SrfK
VQSKSRHAGAFDGSGTMEYFVRFATGFSDPIGFHSVPKDNAGDLEQTKSELGTPLSAGCVRQWLPDAIALWDFAPIGTKVVVTA